jgi:hypothetical protein
MHDADETTKTMTYHLQGLSVSVLLALHMTLLAAVWLSFRRPQRRDGHD